jgi:formate/nitrite transporter FocA (FNT family)
MKDSETAERRPPRRHDGDEQREWREPPAESAAGGRDQDDKDRQREEDEIHEKAAASAHVVYHAIMKEGEEELERPSSALWWSGLAAGLSMGFSLVAEGLLRAYLPESHWRPLVAKLGYSVGFIIVVLGRQQLFTENTLTPILPLLKRKELAVFGNVMRLWGVVLVANLIGAAAFACVVAKTPAFDPEVKQAFGQIGREAMKHGFGTVLLRGIFAGWLIALMVWLLPVAEVARVWVILIITYLVGLAGSSHIIVGSIESLYLVASGASTWGQYAGHYMLPALVGNIIGGVSLVAALNHAQVVAGSGEEGKRGE